MNIYQVTDEFLRALDQIHGLIKGHMSWQDYNQWLSDNFGFVHGQAVDEYRFNTYAVTDADLFLLFKIQYGC